MLEMEPEEIFFNSSIKPLNSSGTLSVKGKGRVNGICVAGCPPHLHPVFSLNEEFHLDIIVIKCLTVKSAYPYRLGQRLSLDS